MNTVDDCVHNRVVAAAAFSPDERTLLIVLDGGELLTVAAPDRPDSGLHWSYQTSPSPRALLGLGAASRPRGGHGRPLEAQSPAPPEENWLKALRDRLWPNPDDTGRAVLDVVIHEATGAGPHADERGPLERQDDDIASATAPTGQDRWSAFVVPRADPTLPDQGLAEAQCRITGHSSDLVPDGVYVRVSD